MAIAAESTVKSPFPGRKNTRDERAACPWWHGPVRITLVEYIVNHYACPGLLPLLRQVGNRA